MGSNKRLAVIACSALTAFVGAVRATVAAIKAVVWFADYEDSCTFLDLFGYFWEKWFFEWVFPIIFVSAIWTLPLVGAGVLIAFFIGWIVRKATKKYLPEKQLEKRRKAEKAFFVLSFAPIAVIFIFSVYNTFSNAFWGEFIVDGELGRFWYWFSTLIAVFSIIPILPLCLVWQIAYLVRRKSGR